jgi:hypothetical protein
MKNLPGSALCTMLLAGLLFTGCKKQDLTEPAGERVHETNSISSNAMSTDDQFRNKHKRFDWRTLWELLQARAATAKYQNIRNAIKDGYADIGVVLPNMGHHYMDTSIVDGKFEVSKPEILVYNKRHDGSFQLVAVEYAVPINLTPDKAPKGFTGNADVWDRNTGFGLWLLHAWVWYFNPDGVFNPTNPLIHVHDH